MYKKNIVLIYIYNMNYKLTSSPLSGGWLSEANSSTRLMVVGLLVAASIKLYVDHRKKNYKGGFKEDNVYNNTSALKHDLSKAFFIELFVLLMYGLNSDKPFLDTENLMNSELVRMGVVTGGYFVFYELVQPLVNKYLPRI
jgi:hypothetical protein